MISLPVLALLFVEVEEPTITWTISPLIGTLLVPQFSMLEFCHNSKATLNAWAIVRVMCCACGEKIRNSLVKKCYQISFREQVYHFPLSCGKAVALVHVILVGGNEGKDVGVVGVCRAVCNTVK
jgi:hypothetical protein